MLREQAAPERMGRDMRASRTRRLSIPPGLTILAIAGLIGLALGLVSLGFSDRLWSRTRTLKGSVSTETLGVEFVHAFSNDDGAVNDPQLDAGDDGTDPGGDQDVASCAVEIDAAGAVIVQIGNGYPGYRCTFWITARNSGRQAIRRLEPVVVKPEAIALGSSAGAGCFTLRPRQAEQAAYTLIIGDRALQNAGYEFQIRRNFSEAIQGRFSSWKNWRIKFGFSEAEVATWLANVAQHSDWLKATTIAEMEAIFAAANSKRGRDEFLANYLVMRLNREAGMICPTDRHNLVEVDAGNFLGLAESANASLSEIIAAIEDQAGNTPTEDQFKVMRDACQGINRHSH